MIDGNTDVFLASISYGRPAKLLDLRVVVDFHVHEKEKPSRTGICLVVFFGSFGINT